MDCNKWKAVSVEKIREEFEPIYTKVLKEMIPQCPPEIAAKGLEKGINTI